MTSSDPKKYCSPYFSRSSSLRALSTSSGLLGLLRYSLSTLSIFASDDGPMMIPSNVVRYWIPVYLVSQLRSTKSSHSLPASNVMMNGLFPDAESLSAASSS